MCVRAYLEDPILDFLYRDGWVFDGKKTRLDGCAYYNEKDSWFFFSIMRNFEFLQVHQIFNRSNPSGLTGIQFYLSTFLEFCRTRWVGGGN